MYLSAHLRSEQGRAHPLPGSIETYTHHTRHSQHADGVRARYLQSLYATDVSKRRVRDRDDPQGPTRAKNAVMTRNIDISDECMSPKYKDTGSYPNCTGTITSRTSSGLGNARRSRCRYGVSCLHEVVEVEGQFRGGPDVEQGEVGGRIGRGRAVRRFVHAHDGAIIRAQLGRCECFKCRTSSGTDVGDQEPHQQTRLQQSKHD